MPDATSRFSLDGKPILHYMGTSTFSNYIVVPEIALAKVRRDAPFETVCYIGCGVTTGVGAVIFTAGVGAGANVAVFGLGGIGPNVSQGREIVDWYMAGKLNIDDLITHKLKLHDINTGFELMKRGESIRSVVVF